MSKPIGSADVHLPKTPTQRPSTGPATNADYLLKEYWDTRFQSERQFEVSRHIGRSVMCSPVGLGHGA